MSKPFLIANRNCGLGDILGNAALCWYLAKKSNSDLIVDWQQMLTRIDKMNKRYAEISTLPRSYVDPIYGLHGSHRKS